MATDENAELDLDDLKALEALDRDTKEWQRDIEVERTFNLLAPSTLTPTSTNT